MTSATRKGKKAKPIDRLVMAMDACAVARGEAQFTHGYRARFAATSTDEAEERRLYAKEQAQWADAERVEKRFRRLALAVLREAAR